MVDEVTGRTILPRSALVHGRYYVGRCGHGTIGRWNAETGEFNYWREKGEAFTYVDTAPHPEDEAWMDVFNPVRELLNPKFEIPLDYDREL